MVSLSGNGATRIVNHRWPRLAGNFWRDGGVSDGTGEIESKLAFLANPEFFSTKVEIRETRFHD